VSEKVTVKDLARLGKVTYTGIRDLFKPIKSKCLGLIVGNHEKQYMRRLQQEDLHGWLCTELDVADLGYSCLMDVVFCQNSQTREPKLMPTTHRNNNSSAFRVWCHHGAGAAQTKGGKINRLTSFMRNFDADIFFMGHVHDQMGARLQVLEADRDCTKLTNREKLGVISGSFLKTYARGVTTYGEQKGYEPTTLGAAWVAVKPDTREMWGRI
jgi:predicted phosphodiesterase